MGDRIRWLPTPTQSHLLCLKIPPKNGSFMGSLMVHQVDISGYQRIWEPQFSDNHGNMSGFSAQLITITIFRQTHLRGLKKKKRFMWEISPWNSMEKSPCLLLKNFSVDVWHLDLVQTSTTSGRASETHSRPATCVGGTSKGLYLGYNQRNMCRAITKDYDMYNHNSSTIEFRGWIFGKFAGSRGCNLPFNQFWKCLGHDLTDIIWLL